jgi:hypothetical protein
MIKKMIININNMKKNVFKAEIVGKNQSFGAAVSGFSRKGGGVSLNLLKNKTINP